MIQIAGLYWPDTVGEQWKHSLAHVGSIEWAIAACKQRRVAVQAGGNIGLWPRRLAESFEHVLTFEPEPISRACLEQNVFKNVLVSGAALGDRIGPCAIRRKSLGGHRITDGTVQSSRETPVEMITIDSLDLAELDLLQLDVEGYEWHALMGGMATIQECQPVIQVELRDEQAGRFGKSNHDVRSLLSSLGYRLGAERPGSDFVFLPRAA